MSKLVHRNRRGVIISTPLDSDRVVERKLKSCCHCGFTWMPQAGSGRLAGWCDRCCGDVCGNPLCVARGCLPVEAQLEQMEAGIPFHLTHESLRPTRILVPGGSPLTEG